MSVGMTKLGSKLIIQLNSITFAWSTYNLFIQGMNLYYLHFRREYQAIYQFNENDRILRPLVTVQYYMYADEWHISVNVTDDDSYSP